MAVDEVPGDDETGLGRHLLDLLAVLSAAGVPRWLLAPAPGPPSGTPTAGARRHLADRSLVSLSTDGDMVSEHRLMRRVVCEALGVGRPTRRGHRGRRRRWWRPRWCRPSAPGRSGTSATTWSPRSTRWPRRSRTAPAGTIEPETGLAVLRLRQWSVRHLYLAYDPARAIALGEALRADCERVLGADHPDTLATLHDLARGAQVGRPGRGGDRPARADGRRPGAGARRGPPGHARVPQQSGRRLPDRGPTRRGDRAVRADRGRPHAGAAAPTMPTR